MSRGASRYPLLRSACAVLFLVVAAAAADEHPAPRRNDAAR